MTDMGTLWSKAIGRLPSDWTEEQKTAHLREEFRTYIRRRKMVHFRASKFTPAQNDAMQAHIRSAIARMEEVIPELKVAYTWMEAHR